MDLYCRLPHVLLLLLQANRVEESVVKYGLSFQNSKCRMVSLGFSSACSHESFNETNSDFRIKSRRSYTFIIGDFFLQPQDSSYLI